MEAKKPAGVCNKYVVSPGLRCHLLMTSSTQAFFHLQWLNVNRLQRLYTCLSNVLVSTARIINFTARHLPTSESHTKTATV